jgi:hypothetical protein
LNKTLDGCLIVTREGRPGSLINVASAEQLF